MSRGREPALRRWDCRVVPGMTVADGLTEHGGALDVASARFPDAPRPWLDLSTGINAVPYPVSALEPHDWTRLPDRASLSRLEAAASRRYAAPKSIAVVAAPGAQSLIQLLPSLVPGTDTRILGPTYGEYAAVLRTAGLRPRLVGETTALAGADLAIVVNPNNPDGRLVSPIDLAALAPRVGLLVVDESFVDLAEAGSSLVPHQPARTLVLRSFGKTYGLAGLRLGFALATEPMASRVRQSLGPWPVSGPAIAVATRALADDAWLESTRRRLVSDVARLDMMMRRVSATVIGGTALFRLIEHPAAPTLFHHLGRHGILVRPFADHARQLRFGIPGTASEWDRFAVTLRSFD